jgi:hypothetical protein
MDDDKDAYSYAPLGPGLLKGAGSSSAQATAMLQANTDASRNLRASPLAYVSGEMRDKVEDEQVVGDTSEEANRAELARVSDALEDGSQGGFMRSRV